MNFYRGDLVKVFDENGDISLGYVQTAEGSVVWLPDDLYWRDTGFRIGRRENDQRRIEQCSEAEAELFG